LKDTLLSIAVLAAILIVSALITNWFARTMYNRCPACATLNAKRRAECRSCGHALR
jgi:rRNA maturation endonuclease Nob1